MNLLKLSHNAKRSLLASPPATLRVHAPLAVLHEEAVVPGLPHAELLQVMPPSML